MKAGHCEKPGKARTDICVAAPTPHCPGVQIHVPRESSALGIGKVTAEIDVFDDDNAAGPKCVAHFHQGSIGRRQMGENEPRMNQVELLSRIVLSDIGKTKFDVADLLSFGLGSCQFELDLVDIRGNHPASGTDHLCEVEGQIAAAAPHFEACHSGPNAGALQER
jgi:hypothetical protein